MSAWFSVQLDESDGGVRNVAVQIVSDAGGSATVISRDPKQLIRWATTLATAAVYLKEPEDEA